jgi:signal transduction protein with GAF and PtsI domain
MRHFDAEHRFASRVELHDATLNAIQDAVMCDGISIFELSADGNFLQFAATRTLVRDLLHGLRLHLGTGIVGRTAQTGKAIYVNDVQSHPDFYALADQAVHFRTRAVLCAPLCHRGTVTAVIELVNKVPQQPFDDRELTAVQSLAQGAAGFWHRHGGNDPGEAPRETFYELTRMVRNLVDVEGISLFTVDHSAGEVRLLFSDTTRKMDLKGARLNLDQGVAGAVATSGEPLLVRNVGEEPRFFHGVDAVSMFSTQSIAAAPITDLGQALGVLEVVNGRGSEEFNEHDLGELVRVAAEMGRFLVTLPR